MAMRRTSQDTDHGSKVRVAGKTFSPSVFSFSTKADMTTLEKQVYAETMMDNNANIDVLVSFLVDFFNDVEKHQGRMLKRDRCHVARKACAKVLKMYNEMATQYNQILGLGRSVLQGHAFK